jgi:hypothetical protein
MSVALPSFRNFGLTQMSRKNAANDRPAWAYMQNYLKLALMALLSLPALLEASTPAGVLSVKAECIDNAHCIFANYPVFIQLTITNVSTQPIGVPVKFLDKKGPHCVLIDSETREQFSLSAPPPADLSLKNKFTLIPPGASIKIKEMVPRPLISAFREDLVDVVTKCTVIVDVKLEGTEGPVRQSATTTIRILGVDKFELDNK